MKREEDRPELTFEEKINLARKASNASESQFYDLCRSNNLITSELEYWCDAYRSSGPAGLKSLGPATEAPEQLMSDAQKAVQGFLKRSFTEENFTSKRNGNRITVYQITSFEFTEEEITWPVFQIRYLEESNSWHLFWHRASGKWWPYVADNKLHSLYDCLQAIYEDNCGCFWG